MAQKMSLLIETASVTLTSRASQDRGTAADFLFLLWPHHPSKFFAASFDLKRLEVIRLGRKQTTDLNARRFQKWFDSQST
jgi:hypothetical protein